MRATVLGLLACVLMPGTALAQDANYTETGWFAVMTDDRCMDVPGPPGENAPMANYAADLAYSGLSDTLIGLAGQNGVPVGVIVITPASKYEPTTTAVYFKTQLWCESWKDNLGQLIHTPMN